MAQPDFNNLPTRLGVYTLIERLGHHELTDLYLATQTHMERGVVVQVLHPESDKQAVDYFLRMVRAKGAAELPRVSRVLESMMSGNIWFLTQEQPVGRSLAQMARDEVRLSTRQACAIISAAAELYTAAETRGYDTEPLGADSIFIHGEGDVHFLSPVVPGQFDPAKQAERLPAQMQALADALEPVLPQNVPGQTRVATLVQWLREGYEGSYMEWQSVGSTAAIINEQTAPVLSRSSVENLNSRVVTQQIKQKRAQRKMKRLILTIGISMLAIILMACVGVLLAPAEVKPLPYNAGGYVYIECGSSQYRVSGRPVSIGDYHKFLVKYEDANSMHERKRALINKGIPEQYTNHTPAEWEEQLQAASANGLWRGRRLNPESPVCGVSYWDALAYANYVGAQLPSAQLLSGAREVAGKENLPEEWCTGERQAISVYEGGTLVLPPTGREWPSVVPDRAVRDVNRGFRLVYPVSANKE